MSEKHLKKKFKTAGSHFTKRCENPKHRPPKCRTRHEKQRVNVQRP